MKRYPHENVLFNTSLWERKRQLILRKQWQNRENWKLISREKWWVLSEQRLDRPVFFAYMTHSFQTKNFHTQIWLLIWNRISWKIVIDMNWVMRVRVKVWYSVPVISLWFTNGKTTLCHHQYHRFYISTLILRFPFAFERRSFSLKSSGCCSLFVLW
jgi:hypothetical protein